MVHVTILKFASAFATQYKDESSSIFGVTFPLSISTTFVPPTPVVS